MWKQYNIVLGKWIMPHAMLWLPLEVKFSTFTEFAALAVPPQLLLSVSYPWMKISFEFQIRLGWKSQELV